MSTDSDSGDDTGESELSSTDCPHCGHPIKMVVVNGPGEARASPCGCYVVPRVLERG